MIRIVDADVRSIERYCQRVVAIAAIHVGNLEIAARKNNISVGNIVIGDRQCRRIRRPQSGTSGGRAQRQVNRLVQFIGRVPADRNREGLISGVTGSPVQITRAFGVIGSGVAVPALVAQCTETAPSMPPTRCTVMVTGCVPEFCSVSS